MHDSTGRTKFSGQFSSAEEAFLAYKTAKESLIKRVAQEYKNRTSPKLYEAMIRYEIQITD